MLVHSAVSCGRLMQQACGSVTLAPLSSSFPEAVTTITVQELSDSIFEYNDVEVNSL
jgi:hypothetical protein